MVQSGNENHNENVNKKTNTDDTNRTDRVIWWCWLQGLEQAPEIVKACYRSLERHLVQGTQISQITQKEVAEIPCQARDEDRNEGYEIKVIDNANWREYVELPGYIVEKWEKGRIPAAMFSDLLRVELLIRYGGTWCDATVLCTGLVASSKSKDESSKSVESSTALSSKLEELLEAELFLFQYTKEGSVPVSISNWFITARKKNEVFRVLQEMLYAYWKDYDCVLNYYIFHLFFAMISKEWPEKILAMLYAQSQNSLVLLHHWGEKFDQKKWDKLTSQVCFHKLAFRASDEVKNNKENYYNHILKEYGDFQYKTGI